MEGEALQPAGVATPKAPYSPVVVSGDLVVTAGQVAFDEKGELVSGEIEGQARQVFDNLERCLEAAESSLDEVIKVNAFLADLADFEAYNDVYREYFSAPYPVRTTVQAGLAPGLRLEVEAIARRRS
jgi:2-iminobutanoate/2-iminopropanoate deaminase